ncbi:uncharacterized protein [Diabrotica undecimpunctata]|uniref:uncharacterized protein n=1 Tax=Diabrotica undecimpunctata TaxID=50387 RepID=UPI003B638645
MIPRKSFLVLVVIIVISDVESYRILGVFPHTSNSHSTIFLSVMKGLVEKGHNVTVVSTRTFDTDRTNYRHIDLSKDITVTIGTVNISTVNNDHALTRYLTAYHLFNRNIDKCHQGLSSPTFQKFLKMRKQRYDVVIFEYFAVDCFLGVVSKINAPIIGLSSSTLMPWISERVGNPSNTAYVPNNLLAFSDKMTFWERVENTLISIVHKLLFQFYKLPKDKKLARKYIGKKGSKLEKFLYNSSLILSNTHFSLNLPRPLVPNVIEIGGIHIDKPHPLPESLKRWIETSRSGVIYFSLGSLINGQSLGEERKNIFLKTFERFPQKVIWKWENESVPHNHDKVLLGKWMPQLDILCHPNTRLFISHGGLLSVMEAVHCGVPMVIIPQIGEQYTNAKALEAQGAGIILLLSEISEATTFNAVQEGLSSKIKENMEQLSSRFRDRPLSPLDTAIYWVEYVIRHKGAPHMKTAAVDMPFYQYYLLDVFFMLFLIFFGFLYLLAFSTKCICKFIFSLGRNKKEDKTEKRSEGVPLSEPIVAEKALFLNMKLNGDPSFKGSSGWLEKFKNRHGIRKLKNEGVKLSAASIEVVDEYKRKFQAMIDEYGLTRDQVFNADETSLNYKALPTKTLAALSEKHAPGFQKKSQLASYESEQNRLQKLIKEALLDDEEEESFYDDDDQEEDYIEEKSDNSESKHDISDVEVEASPVTEAFFLEKTNLLSRKKTHYQILLKPDLDFLLPPDSMKLSFFIKDWDLPILYDLPTWGLIPIVLEFAIILGRLLALKHRAGQTCWGFSLHEALEMLEEDEFPHSQANIVLLPPEDAAETDEDSGDEENVSPDNLPSNMLRTVAEIHVPRSVDSDSDDDIPLSNSVKSEKVLKIPRQYHWSEVATTSEEAEILDWSKDNDLNIDTKDTPIDWFMKLFDEEIFDLLVVESNRYASMKNKKNKPICIEEIKAFVGILILSGYAQYPRKKMYWEKDRDVCNSLVSGALARDRFDFIMSVLHIADNNNLDHYDKFSKVRPLFRLLNQNFLKHAVLEENHSVDEAMVPYFGRHGCKQFIKGKPIRWGYKLWVGCNKNGTMPLFEMLTEKNIRGTGTIRSNRIPKNPLKSAKELQKDKRGSYDAKFDGNKKLTIVSWHDNSVVSLCSNAVGTNPIHQMLPKFGALLIFLSVFCCVASLNILVLFPTIAKSHYLVFKPMFEELANRGHTVNIISGTSLKQKTSNKNVKYIHYIDTTDTSDKTLSMDLFSQSRTQTYMEAFVGAILSKIQCEKFMNSTTIKTFSQGSDKYDIILSEIFVTNCYFALAKIYDAPIIGLSSTDLLPWMYQWYGSPENPSYIPVLFMDYSDKMSFFQRVENTLMLLFTKLVHLYYIAPTGNEYSKKYLGVDLFEGGDILYNMSLLLTNRHYTYQTPKPLSPNIIEVGGIHLGKPKKLPETLDKLVSGAPSGVILISMGSTLKGSTFPEEQRKMFLKVFSQLKYTVIWKWENDTMEGLPSNVKTHKWLPQFDLLCHPNLKLFITHGGLLGGQEAVYCGVPMLILPQFADQHLNAAALEKTGASLHIKLRSATEKSLTEAINKVLTPEFAQNAKLLSERFKDRPMSPMDTAIYWIEYVAKYKGAPFMRTAVTDMPFYQYLLLDVIGFLILLSAIFIYVFYFSIKRIIRLVIKTSPQSKIKKH